MIVGTLPFAYFIAMRAGAKRSTTDSGTPTLGLRVLMSGAGHLMFDLANRGITPLPPRGPAGALDILLAEVEANANTGERRVVQRLRTRLDQMAAETATLRAREREIDRAIAEAGPGATADTLGAARREIPKVERIAATIDEIRLKLLLVRSGVTPVAELTVPA